MLPNRHLDLSDLDALALALDLGVDLELADGSQVPQWYRNALEGDGLTEGILITTGDLRRGVLEFNSARTAVTVNGGRPIPARVKEVGAIVGGAWATQADRRNRRVPFQLRNVARLLFDGRATGNYQRQARSALVDLAGFLFQFANPDGSGEALTFGKVRWDRHGRGVFTIAEEIHRLLLAGRYQSIPIQLASLPYNRFDLWNEVLFSRARRSSHRSDAFRTTTSAATRRSLSNAWAWQGSRCSPTELAGPWRWLPWR